MTHFSRAPKNKVTSFSRNTADSVNKIVENPHTNLDRIFLNCSKASPKSFSNITQTRSERCPDNWYQNNTKQTFQPLKMQTQHPVFQNKIVSALQKQVTYFKRNLKTDLSIWYPQQQYPLNIPKTYHQSLGQLNKKKSIPGHNKITLRSD